MELDNLKEIWKEAGAFASGTKSDRQLMEMLGRHSRSPVAKMRRNLLYELITLVVSFGAMIVFYFVKWKGQWSEVAWAYLLMGAVFIVYFYFKNRLLREMQCSSCAIRSNVQLQVNKLEAFVHGYLVYGTLILGLFLLFLGVLLYFKLPSDAPKMILFRSPAYAWWQTATVWLVLTALLSWGFYYLNRWYLHCLYGRHIARLQGLLRQMDDETGENDGIS